MCWSLLPKVIEMFTNYMAYRNGNNLDTIITVRNFFISYPNHLSIRISISTQKLKSPNVIQEDTVVLIRSEDPFISRDLVRLSLMVFGLLPQRKSYGSRIINHMRFFRNKFLCRAQLYSENKFSTHFLYWT